MFWTRFASGVILAPLFLAVVYGGLPYFQVLVAAIAGVMAWEFIRMDAQFRSNPKRKPSIYIRTAFIIVVSAVAVLMGALGLVFVVFATILVVISDHLIPYRGFHIGQIATAYAAIPGIALVLIMKVGGPESLFWLLAVVWATDIGAYALGRMIGGAKLAPAVSPNKTWSGAVGGLACAILASGVVFWAYHHAISPGLALVAGLLSIVSQAGDLFESALKRRYQVKDSGALIPGHGGVMDRFDGLWAAAPVAAFFCVILDGGVQHW